MFKSKIFNSVMRYMLVAMLALLPNAIWGEVHLNAYIQEFKTAWGTSEGKGVFDQ